MGLVAPDKQKQLCKSMNDKPRGGLTALCIAQTTSWGLLFYSLPVAVAPIAAETGWTHTSVTGALTAGLIISAFAGIKVGKILDAQGPRKLMTLGAIIGVLSMVLVAWSPNLMMFYLGWIVAGVAQAAVLYQPAFVVITRWYGIHRVRPLTTLTLVAGLASTIFAPIVAALIDQWGWRLSYIVIAVILAVITIPLHFFFLNSRWSPKQTTELKKSPHTSVQRVTRSKRFITLTIVMTVVSFTVTAVTINVVPLMLERGMSYTTAAWTLGLVGAGQLIGRVGYAPLVRVTTPQSRLLIILVVATTSLWAMSLIPGPLWVLIIISVLAGGARGCHTLLQATAVSDRWGTENFGTLNARFSAPMTFAGALAPVAGPAIAQAVGGYAMMSLIMAAVLTVVCLFSLRT